MEGVPSFLTSCVILKVILLCALYLVLLTHLVSLILFSFAFSQLCSHSLITSDVYVSLHLGFLCVILFVPCYSACEFFHTFCMDFVFACCWLHLCQINVSFCSYDLGLKLYLGLLSHLQRVTFSWSVFFGLVFVFSFFSWQYFIDFLWGSAQVSWVSNEAQW